MGNLTFDEMIAAQTESESFLESILDLTVNTTPISEQMNLNESSLLECDENGVFADDEQDDEIDRKLGV